MPSDSRRRGARPVTAATTRRPVRRRPEGRAPASGRATLSAIPLFAAVYLVVAWRWHVPSWIAVLYGAASVACFGVYAWDKSAARAGRRRVSESTLLWLGVLGGWPGALVAQQALRHKSSKVSFRSAFWFTVALNGAVFVGWHTLRA